MTEQLNGWSNEVKSIGWHWIGVRDQNEHYYVPSVDVILFDQNIYYFPVPEPQPPVVEFVGEEKA